MKKIFSISVFFILISNHCIFSQNVPEEILTAFKKGNSTLLSQYFNSSIELTIENNDNFYSKNQAEQILKDFFNKNSIISFNITHQGEKNDAIFFIGSLNTNKGTYRVTAYLKFSKNQKLIHQLRIEKKDE